MEVREGLWVGGWKELEDGMGEWTHVLSVDGPHVSKAKEFHPSVKRMTVNILDMPQENLLQHLTRCLGFISRALQASGKADAAPGEGESKASKVLVHCHAGQSRSVAIVAAYLMRLEGLSFEEAMDVIKQANPDANPNEGFREQLKLYEKMGCRIDVNNSLYRHHLLKQQGKRAIGQNSLESLEVGTSKLAQGVGQEAEVVASDTVDPESSDDYAILCRKCRSVLAVSSQVIPHSPPEYKAKVPRKWQAQGRTGQIEQCSSVYLEPLKWMEEVESGANEGKLNCYKCHARVGYFSWSGTQCSCSQWVTPAFQVHKSKVDIVYGETK